MDEVNGERRYSAWLQRAYRVILSSYRQLSKVCLLLKSCPYGFISGEKKEGLKKNKKNKKNGALHQEKEKSCVKGSV